MNEEKMVWYYGNEKPANIEMKLRLGQRQFTINFNIEKLKKQAYKYRWQSVKLEPGVWAYGPIVNAIVTERYPEDTMQAIVNNYLMEPRTTEAEAEMQAMQDWRAYAKEVAKDCLTEISA